MNADKIPDIIIGRLPIYLRALQRMSDKGMKTTSSQELGEYVGISAAQIRKDISQFGEFGKQGTGYSIPFLIDKLREILKVNRMWDVVIVGLGDMGHALARYGGFGERGFRVAMILRCRSIQDRAEGGRFHDRRCRRTGRACPQLQDQAGDDGRAGRGRAGGGRQAGAGRRQGHPELRTDRAERSEQRARAAYRSVRRICSA